jgi:competence protein ComEA
MNKILQPLALAILLALPLAAAGKGTAKEKAPSHPININTATATELTQLPKIGAKAAERIVAYRKAHGGFQRTEDLMSVKGVGEKSFVKLKPYLSVGNGSSQAKSTTKLQGK